MLASHPGEVAASIDVETYGFAHVGNRTPVLLRLGNPIHPGWPRFHSYRGPRCDALRLGGYTRSVSGGASARENSEVEDAQLSRHGQSPFVGGQEESCDRSARRRNGDFHISQSIHRCLRHHLTARKRNQKVERPVAYAGSWLHQQGQVAPRVGGLHYELRILRHPSESFGSRMLQTLPSFAPELNSPAEDVVPALAQQANRGPHSGWPLEKHCRNPQPCDQTRQRRASPAHNPGERHGCNPGRLLGPVAAEDPEIENARIVDHGPAAVRDVQAKRLKAVAGSRRQPKLQPGPPRNAPFRHKRTVGVEHLQGLRGQTHTRSRLDIQQYRGPGRGDAEPDLRVVLDPAKWLWRFRLLHRKPTPAKMDTRFRSG